MVGKGDGTLDRVSRSAYRNEPSNFRSGVDLWHLYEASYLDQQGKPWTGTLVLEIPAFSPYIVESKSLKLFLNQLNTRRFPSHVAYLDCIKDTLSSLLESEIHLFPFTVQTADLSGYILLDSLTASITDGPNRLLLQEGEQFTFKAVTHLFRSLCPVTQQPDWASVQIHFKGQKGVELTSLFAYLLSFYSSGAFHEACCEHIFTDLWNTFNPIELDVSCHFLRRGGIDIHPRRASSSQIKPQPSIFR